MIFDVPFMDSRNANQRAWKYSYRLQGNTNTGNTVTGYRLQGNTNTGIQIQLPVARPETGNQ
jgi:hypothetical protein